ncbi:MAG: ribbon-helix-helix protein, CopG family [Acidianus infernus]|nr:ribbon-helix-helix protein, CopG family [Acidianus infernus]
MTKVVTFKAEEDLVNLMDRYAMKYKLSRSEAIRKAIENLVKDEVNKETAVVRVVDFW